MRVYPVYTAMALYAGHLIGLVSDAGYYKRHGCIMKKDLNRLLAIKALNANMKMT
jgi:hypothetical protein